MRDDMVELGIPVHSMTPVPSSVDLDQVPYEEFSSPRTLRRRGERKRVVYVGTLKRVRKLDFVVRAFAKVLTEEPNTELLIVGKGDKDSDISLLESEARNCGIDDAVRFTGHVGMPDVWEYIRSADVCLSPYFPTPILQSTSPTKLVEYMAMGKAVVANDHPEQRLVIEKSRAGYCTAWDEQEFASAIVKLLQNPDKAAEMGRRGREYVENNRTNTAMADLVEHTYLKFLESGSIAS
jgi:glycosyltransferase involved in cell wall biosynthesis